MRVLLVGLLLVAVASAAQAVNKCTDPATGAVSYSDGPCARGDRQGTVKVEAPRAYGGRGEPSSSQGRDRQANPAVEGPREAYQLLALYRRWIDAERLAASTPRLALAERVDALQEIKRTAAALVVPECLERARDALATLAAQSAQGYMAFLGRQELGTMVYAWVERKPSIEAFERAVQTAVCPSDIPQVPPAR